MSELSPYAKAEILATVLHELSDHLPQAWGMLPLVYQEEVRRALSVCAVDHEDLYSEDIESIKEFFSNAASA
jgi:hypothetical protein